jgi:hypothetical protein
MSTILGNLRQLFKDFRARSGLTLPVSPVGMNALFRFRYTLFKELLVANSELLTVLSDMDEKLKGETIFGLSYINNQVNKALKHALSDGQMPQCHVRRRLPRALQRVGADQRTDQDHRQ